LPKTFPPRAHAVLRPLRPGHFWFETRIEILLRTVGGLTRPGVGPALEVGCGDGFVLGSLPGRDWIGLDEGLEDLATARRDQRLRVVAASGKAIPLRIRCDLVVAFDVLEHIEEDVGALSAWRSILDPRGWLVLTVPAGPELWSHRDDYAGHVRRYTREGLRETVEAAGFRVERVRPMFRLLWPLARVAAWHPRREMGEPSSAYAVPKVANSWLRRLLNGEERIFGESPWGRGTSWLLVARPREGPEPAGRA
jgi:SAM-dependent methyltransferase